MQTDTVIECTKWGTALNHLRNNRIEYLLLVGILHLVGATNKVYSQVQGVCI